MKLALILAVALSTGCAHQVNFETQFDTDGRITKTNRTSNTVVGVGQSEARVATDGALKLQQNGEGMSDNGTLALMELLRLAAQGIAAGTPGL